MEKSRDAVTLSNIRAAYAQAQTAYLTGSNDGDDVVYIAKVAASGSVAAADAKVEVKHVEAKGQKGTIDNFDQLPFAAKASGLMQMAIWVVHLENIRLRLLTMRQESIKLKQLRSNAVTHHYDIICLNKATSWN